MKLLRKSGVGTILDRISGYYLGLERLIPTGQACWGRKSGEEGQDDTQRTS